MADIRSHGGTGPAVSGTNGGGEFRAKGDDEGAIFNMLVYPPCFTLIAMGIYNIEAMHANLRKMNVVCATIYAAILAIFGVGYSQSGNFHIGNWLYVMVFLFGVNLAYCHVMIIVEIRKRRKMLEEMAGNDILPYVRFARASVIILLLLIIAMPVAVLSTDFLYVIGPLELLALLFFTISFVSLGYNYNPAEELLDKDVEENYAVMENGQMETTQIKATKTESTQTEIEQTESAQTENGGEAAPCAEEQNVEQDKKEETLQQQFAAARQKIIREKLDAWCASRGYKDTSVNMISLARSLSITKTELSRYHLPYLAGRGALRGGQADDIGASRLQQRRHLCGMWLLVAILSLPDVQGEGRLLAYGLERKK